LGIPTQVLLVFLPATAVCVWVLHRTRSGRVLYQVGTSQLAASLVGIDVRRARFTLYCVSGLLAGLGAIVTNSWLLTARPSAGAGLELQGDHHRGARGSTSSAAGATSPARSSASSWWWCSTPACSWPGWRLDTDRFAWARCLW